MPGESGKTPGRRGCPGRAWKHGWTSHITKGGNRVGVRGGKLVVAFAQAYEMAWGSWGNCQRFSVPRRLELTCQPKESGFHSGGNGEPLEDVKQGGLRSDLDSRMLTPAATGPEAAGGGAKLHAGELVRGGLQSCSGR